MLNISLLKRIIALLFIVGFLDIIAYIFYFHWIFWWYDVTLHFLAGYSVGMTIVFVWGYFFDLSITSKIKMLCIAVIGSFIIGFLWEIYELLVKQTSLTDGLFYWWDTISDLILDTCGGFFGALYSYKIIDKK